MAEQDQGELWLTYAELGARLGVSADGARTRAKRARWPVSPGNDGRARVRVRAAELPERPPKPARRPPGRALVGPGRPPELQDLLARAVGEAEHARAAAERALAEAAQLRAELARFEERAKAAEAVAQVEIAAARRVAAAEVAAQAARVEELRAQLAEARRPWWRRWLG